MKKSQKMHGITLAREKDLNDDKKQFSVNIIWNEWIFEEIERSKMLGEGLCNSGESQLEWTRNLRKINLYKITAKAKSAVAISSWTNSAIILLMYFFLSKQ